MNATATQPATTCFDIYINGKMADFAMWPNFEKETEKAVLVRIMKTVGEASNSTFWIPKSLLSINEAELEAHLPGWFVSKNIAPKLW